MLFLSCIKLLFYWRFEIHQDSHWIMRMTRKSEPTKKTPILLIVWCEFLFHYKYRHDKSTITQTKISPFQICHLGQKENVNDVVLLSDERAKWKSKIRHYFLKTAEFKRNFIIFNQQSSRNSFRFQFITWTKALFYN